MISYVTSENSSDNNDVDLKYDKLPKLRQNLILDGPLQ